MAVFFMRTLDKMGGGGAIIAVRRQKKRKNGQISAPKSKKGKLKKMEIVELLNFCKELNIGDKILDIILIILYLSGKKKTAEELQAKKEKDLKKQKKKTAKAIAKAKAEALKEEEMEKE